MHQLEKLKKMEMIAIAAAAFIILLALVKKSFFLGSLSLWIVIASLAIQGVYEAQTGRGPEALKQWVRCGLLLLLSILFLISRS